MHQSVRMLFAAAVLSASATYLMAGGFALILGNPQASAEARSINAAVTVKAAGCGQPEKAVLQATAVGIVDGRRQTLPLKVVALKQPGMFAVTRQWPSAGKWVIEFVATEEGRNTTTIARVLSDGVDHNSAKTHASASDVAAMLDSAPVLQALK